MMENNTTNITAYLNLAHSDINYIVNNRDELADFFEKKMITNFKYSTTRVDSGIELFRRNEVSLEAANIIDEILEKVKSHFANKFNDFLSSHMFELARIEVIINIYEGHSPSIYLNSEIIKKLSSLNLEIEFDIYNYS